MCEATRQLAKARHELRIQIGNRVIDFGKLEQLLTAQCDEHQERT